MRQVSGTSRAVIAAAGAQALVAAVASAPCSAQGYGGYPYPVSYYNNQSVQYGLNLPQVPVSNGSDEIRAADGTTCKSSISGNGPVLDVGVLGNQDFYGTFASGTIYGRVVMPLGEQPKRLDCTGLYKLEIERLQHELKLVKMGMNSKGAGVSESGGANWQTDGWSGSPRGSKLGGDPAPRQPASAPAPARSSASRASQAKQAPARPAETAPQPVQPPAMAPSNRSETASIASPMRMSAGPEPGLPATITSIGAAAPGGWSSTIITDVPAPRRPKQSANWADDFFSVVR